MKKKEKYEQQKETKRLNEYRILNFLNVGESSFGQLEESTGLTPAGLSKVLKRLVEQEKIIKKGEGKNTRYSLRHGSTAKEIEYLGYKIEEFRKTGGKNYIDFSDNHQSEAAGYGPPFGILSHLFLDKDIGKQFNPILKKDVFEIEKILFEKIKDNLKNKRVEMFIPKKDINKERLVVLALEVKYSRLLEEIENFNEKKHTKLVQTRLKELKQ